MQKIKIFSYAKSKPLDIKLVIVFVIENLKLDLKKKKVKT